MKRALMLMALAGSAACDSDQGLNPNGGDNAAKPDVQVEPARIRFGGVAYDSSDTTSLVVRNVGNAGLDLDALRFEGSGAFSLQTEPSDSRLAAGEELTVYVVYQPINTSDDGWLVVETDDPDTPEYWVPLSGEGLYPELEISPAAADLGSTIVCYPLEQEISLRNVGDAPLVIDSVTSLGEGWAVAGEGALPWSVEPGDEVDVLVSWGAVAGGTSAGILYVESNDPAGQKKGTQTATAEGFAEQEVVDTWRQPDGPWDSVDMVFFIDQSASMDDDRQNIKENFGHLVESLATAGVSWQAVVVTDDDGCANTGTISSTSSTAVTAFQEGVHGPSGWYAESGLTVAAEALDATGSGGCNAGFLRSTAKTVVVVISDEADHSEINHEVLVDRMREAAPTAAVFAIVGDVPDGCASADPGNGYHQAALYSGGEVASICDSDWSGHFDTLADLVGESPTDTIVLTYYPDLDSIEVVVDGLPSETWTFDEALNAVVLDELPPAGAYIEVSYRVADACPE